ncbi:MAG: hypothetical protein AABY02_04135, partial [Nanoarchaeota archaeon]
MEPSIDRDVTERYLASNRSKSELEEMVHAKLSSLGYVDATYSQIPSDGGPQICQRVYFNQNEGNRVVIVAFYGCHSTARHSPSGELIKGPSTGSEDGYIVVIKADNEQMMEIDS